MSSESSLSPSQSGSGSEKSPSKSASSSSSSEREVAKVSSKSASKSSTSSKSSEKESSKSSEGEKERQKGSANAKRASKAVKDEDAQVLLSAISTKLKSDSKRNRKTNRSSSDLANEIQSPRSPNVNATGVSEIHPELFKACYEGDIDTVSKQLDTDAKLVRRPLVSRLSSKGACHKSN
jgi:hypothetical protein